MKPKATEQPDLFAVTSKEVKVEEPTYEEVSAMVKRTGESPHKCYYWLLAEKNKKDKL